MALLAESQLRKLAKAQRGFARDSAAALSESIYKASALSSFDIFLSHSHFDAELLDGTFRFLVGLGYSVYLDSKIDPAPQGGEVTRKTVEQVRKRLKQSKSLFFATTEGAKNSRWMPWELGYMDGLKDKCAILPISSRAEEGDTYEGREYLGVYPYITSARDTKGKKRIWVREDSETYVSFDKWLAGRDPYQHD
jgi:hypothetical protein